MPQNVQVEGGYIQFPDDMSVDDIQSALQTHYAKPTETPSPTPLTPSPEARREAIAPETLPAEAPGARPVVTLPGQEPDRAAIQPESAWDAVKRNPVYRKLFGEEKALGQDVGIVPLLASTPLPFGLEGKPGKALMAYFIGSYIKNRPEAIQNIRQELSSGDTDQATKDILGEILQAGLVGVGSKGVFGSEHPAAQKLTTEGVPDASKVSETTAVYGDVRPQPEQGVREVPVKESGPGIQPQAPKEEVPKQVVLTQSTPEKPAPEPPAAKEGQLGGGAAEPSEFPSDPGNPDIYGIAQRVREQRAKAGQTVPIEPGTGIGAEESVERGRQLLEKDANPEDAITNFEKTKRVSSDDMAVTRAHGEALAKTARETEEKFGTDSPEYKAAFKALGDWDTRTKGMQTEWHKIGKAQQGETDIDTGTFTGIQRAFKQQTGKDLPPSKVPKAKKLAQDVKDATETTAQAQQKLFDEVAPRKPSVSDAERRALDAASKTVREWAAKTSELENKARVAKAGAEKKAAEKARADAAKKLQAAQAELRNAAVKAAEAENKLRVAKADLPTYVWAKAREYIDKGESNFDSLRHKLATDLGLPVSKVTEAMGKTKKAKYLIDDLWKKQQTLRRLDGAAKRWLREAQTPLYRKAIENVPRVLFSLKVGFHGTVALGTHAPMVAFQPRFWKIYAQDFGKMYRMVASPAYYEHQIQDLMRRPNYMTARRAGLVNDPYQYEDYNSPDIMKYFGRLTGMGNRGYSVLKILRQDMFDQHWNNLPKTTRIAEVAESLADGINHATGVVKVSAPRGTAVALFAPRLEMSRVAWLAADPIKATTTFLNWKNASEGDRVFAVNQIKEKAWVAGTMYALLAINQGVLSAVDSKQKINGIPEALGGAGLDPFHSDFLKFKAAGMNFSYGNAMISMARLPVRLYRIRQSDGGKLKNVIYPDENTYSVLGEYARSQESPFASLVTSLWFKGDWQNRPLPGSNRPMPKRLKQQGVQPYTWPEFWAEQVLPIPAEEAVREVWKSGLGMSDEQVAQMRKALATIAIMSATGARLTDDIPYKR